MDHTRGILRKYFVFEFALSDQAWHRYAVRSVLPRNLDSGLLESGLTDSSRELRQLTERINKDPERQTRGLQSLQAEMLLALRTVNQVLRWVAANYFLRDNPGSLDRSRDWIGEQIGSEALGQLYGVFVELFPPLAVSMARISPRDFLDEAPVDGRDLATIEMLLLFLNRANPATGDASDLFDDRELRRRASFVPFVTSLEDFLEQHEPPCAESSSLFHLLRAPMLAHPDSLAGQIDYMRTNWSLLLPEDLLERLQMALDVLKEFDVSRTGGAGPAPVLEFGPDSDAWDSDRVEPEAFSRDADWMSNVVLIAKSVHVWLNQLTRAYGRPIHLLSDIPDEELKMMSDRGITGLWLIGLWERSEASRRIKQYMGNPEAAASAYALREYSISADLGGYEAWQVLRDRAWGLGIRLASDMVPNHMGIDSRWVIEHPEYFLQASHPPYPAYEFSGGDLSDHPGVAIRIEDGYWDHRDASVVFQRVDETTGQARYIYHGNDGTSMPWNDTAQLNFLLPQVREAVIQVILDVARMFPIIRFDAAMTLARKHYQRLWFPAPGDAGAIPSRAEHGMTRPAFEQVFPTEFWREVVDRVAAEVPDTLLLAEAFWLMEGFFVRTLGMHRVYNSAFMNMLKMEENQKYRQTIKNVLEYSPEILKRFVNFLNNPDEKTAVEQFGRGDKYFGCTLLLATMPGLPMLGHGQIEGFSEKYGMEYRKAYWDEQVDQDMVQRHEHDIFPLLRRRHLFSGAENFRLYDFQTHSGHVDENVFAFTNGAGGQRALILYNNSYGSTSGKIHNSVPMNVGSAEDPHLVGHGLDQTLEIQSNPEAWILYRDPIRSRDYLMPGTELSEQGFSIDLQGYEYRVFMNFRLVTDKNGLWAKLAVQLGTDGSTDVSLDYRRLELEPTLARVRKLADPDQLPNHVETLKDLAQSPTANKLGPGTLKEFQSLLKKIPPSGLLASIHLRNFLKQLPDLWIDGSITGQDGASPGPCDEDLVVQEFALAVTTGQKDQTDWRIAVHTARFLARSKTEVAALGKGKTAWLLSILNDPDTRMLLGINKHDGIQWLSMESLQNLLQAMAAAWLLDNEATDPTPLLDGMALIMAAAEKCGYQVQPFGKLLSG
ncbi:MAG: hypothetical protein KOO60_00415 [Gemmatimonadales bacterium]|nr:hypothetical protein [Gemmatimonadales bacterium]